jgi:predicted amidohydrolase YtcJ
VTFHNDGLVSPPLPLLNIQCMTTRRTPSGEVHGPEQQISLDEAFKAHTINAARQLGREHDLGSLEVGKHADLVELSADPFAVDVDALTEQVKVVSTWVNGHKVDTDGFLAAVEAVDPSEHADLSHAALSHTC